MMLIDIRRIVSSLVALPFLLCAIGMTQSSGGSSAALYQHDDGSDESQFGLLWGGELVWLMRFDTMRYNAPADRITEVGTAWGGVMFPGLAPPNGTPASVYVWDDLDDDGDPRTGVFAFLNETRTEVANVDTDVINYTTLSEAVVVQGIFFVGVSVNHVSDQYPAPGDQVASGGRAWVTGNVNQDGFDPTDLDGPGSIGVHEMDELGWPMLWLTRAIGNNAHVALYCPGDGTGSPCPCANETAQPVVSGCSNSSATGAGLAPSGPASVHPSLLLVHGSNLVPAHPALLFAGDVALDGGNGIPFGDGLRCVGVNVLRLGTKVPDSLGRATWGPGLQGWSIGDTKRMQVWYRDPASSPCGSGFNLTNAFEIEFVP